MPRVCRIDYRCLVDRTYRSNYEVTCSSRGREIPTRVEIFRYEVPEARDIVVKCAKSFVHGGEIGISFTRSYYVPVNDKLKYAQFTERNNFRIFNNV